MDLSFGQTYCFLCQDYIYDKEVELIAQVCFIIQPLHKWILFVPLFYTGTVCN